MLNGCPPTTNPGYAPVYELRRGRVGGNSCEIDMEMKYTVAVGSENNSPKGKLACRVY